jgi:hypothetical protein
MDFPTMIMTNNTDIILDDRKTATTNAASYAISSFLYIVSMVLMMIVFVGNKSYVMFMPKRCLGSNGRKKRTRHMMNCIIFLFLVYQAGRFVGSILDIAGEFFAHHPQLKYIGRTSVAYQVLLNQLLLAIISMMVLVWFDLGTFWFFVKTVLCKVTPDVFRICLLVLLITINLLSLTSAVIVSIVNMLGPEHGKTLFNVGFRYNVTINYPISMGIVCLLGLFICGFIITIMIRHVRAMKKNEVTEITNKDGVVEKVRFSSGAKHTKTIVTMIKLLVAMLCIFVALSIRIIGLVLVFEGVAQYLWSTFNNSIPDFLVNLAITPTFWPFAIHLPYLGSVFKPLTNIRSLNSRDSDAQLNPASSDEDTFSHKQTIDEKKESGTTLPELENMDEQQNMDIQNHQPIEPYCAEDNTMIKELDMLEETENCDLDDGCLKNDYEPDLENEGNDTINEEVKLGASVDVQKAILKAEYDDNITKLENQDDLVNQQSTDQNDESNETVATGNCSDGFGEF